jgi:hypothetical protein
MLLLESWKISASIGFITKKFVTLHGHMNVKKKKWQSFIFYFLPRKVFTQTHSLKIDVHVHYIHKTSICTSQGTYSISIRDTNLLMLEISAVFYVRK